MSSRSCSVNTNRHRQLFTPPVDPADPTTWPPERLLAAQQAMSQAAATLFLSADEFTQVTALTGQSVNVIDDVLSLVHLAIQEQHARRMRWVAGGVA